MPFVLNPTWNFSKYRSGPTCNSIEDSPSKIQTVETSLDSAHAKYMPHDTGRRSEKLIQNKAFNRHIVFHELRAVDITGKLIQIL